MQTKRTLATLLAVFLLLAQLTTALAEAPAPAAAQPLMGREIRTTTGLTYHENPLVDEATNATLKALIDSVKLYSRVMQLDDDEGYGELSMAFNEAEAASVQYVQEEDCLYIISPLLPSPVAVKRDEMDVLMANLQAYLGENTDMTVDMAAVTPAGNVNLDFDALMASIDEEAMASMNAAMEEWAATYLSAELYAEEPLESMLGLDATTATIYELRAPALEALMDVFMPIFSDFDAYWTEYYGMITQMPELESELPPLDEFMQMVHSIPTAFEDEAIVGEDFVAYHAACMDKDGNPSVNIAHIYCPADEDGVGEFEFYTEWSAAGDQAIVSIYIDGATITLNLMMPEETVTEIEDGQIIQKTFRAILGLNADGEETYFAIDAASAKTVKSNITDTDVEVIFSVSDGEEAYVLDVLACSTLTAEGEDYTSHTVVDIAFGTGEEMFDLFTIDQIVKTREPQGAPFNPASDILFFFPGSLDEDAFADWVSDEVMMSITEQMFVILAALPEEVLAAFMPVEGVIEGEAIIAP